jgi:hypothetical protein
VSLAAAPYEAEAVLQALLEHHPQLLAGYQMSRGDPRRFLLVCRETPVADHEGGGGRWSIDHVFVDQDGVPTLVEVKRSADTRIRREVVGQMPDYAANGVRYWGDGALQQMFERTCALAGQDPAVVLEETVCPDTDVEDFWARAERNLRGGVLRLVFVADVIPDEPSLPVPTVHSGHRKRLIKAGAGACSIQRHVLRFDVHCRQLPPPAPCGACAQGVATTQLVSSAQRVVVSQGLVPGGPLLAR